MSAQRCRVRGRAGFTLIEAMIATVVIGLGVLALIHSLGAGTRVNSVSRDMTQAVFLAQEIRELTLQLPFSDPDEADMGNPPGPDGADPATFVDDLDDLMNTTYNPPVMASGSGTMQTISGMTGWSQVVDLEWKDPDRLTLTVPDGSSDVINVTATIQKDGRDVLSTSWLVVRRPE